jgi:hypothetical protein
MIARRRFYCRLPTADCQLEDLRRLCASIAQRKSANRKSRPNPILRTTSVSLWFNDLLGNRQLPLNNVGVAKPKVFKLAIGNWQSPMPSLSKPADRTAR